MFDSSLLKETINSLITAGKRNFAIDMSPLDYIYSDTINVLMAMNKRVLDVTGRLSLMAPQPEVMQILKRAGIHNILRIFETETELIKSSEDMIIQTTSLKLSDVNAAIKQDAPPSEFDQLRSEIGSVFSSGEVAQAAPQIQMSAPARAGTEEDFNQMFHQFETGPQISGRGAYGGPPVQSQIPQPQPPKFQPRQFQQPAAQPIPLRPGAPAYPRQPMDVPKFPADYSSVRSETQRFASAPGAVSFQEQRVAKPSDREPFPVEDEASFETAARAKPVRKSRLREDFVSFDEEEGREEEFKKKSPLPVLVVVLLIIALGGAAAFIVYSTMLKKKPQTVVSTVQPQKQEQLQPILPPPQIPVQTVEQQATTEAQKATEQKKEIVESKPEPPPPTPVRKVAPKTVVRKSTPPPSRGKPAVVNEVILTSTPSGASIEINDQRVGLTPYTWKKPVFGRINVQITKSGYKTASKSFEYSGGRIKESFTLEREVKAASPPPVVKRTPRKTAPPPAAVEEDPFADIDIEEEDLTFEAESEPPAASIPQRTTVQTVPTRKTVAPQRSTPTAGGGGEALIFIASIPPVADVFLGDKLIGKTNVSELKIPAGVQTLKFVKGAKEITKQFNLQAGKNPSQMVRIP